MGFFTIHNHSDFSNASLGFADSINQIKKSVDYARDLGLTGYVLTDHEALSGHAELMHYRDELEKKGEINHDSFTIGFGDEIYLVEDLEPNQKYYHHLLIAKDEIGHKILRKVSTQAWNNSFFDRGLQRTPITRNQLKEIMEEEDGKGHIVSSTACLGSLEAQAFLNIMAAENVPFGKELEEDEVNQEKEKIVDFVLWNQSVFGEDDFYLEISPNSTTEQRYVNKRVWTLGKAMNVPVVFSTDSHYLSEWDRDIHRAYLNSKQAEREVDDFYYAAYMMSYDDVKRYMLLDFSEEEVEEMVANLERIRAGMKHYTIFKQQEIPLLDVTVPLINEKVSLEEVQGYTQLYDLTQSEEPQDRYWSISCLNALVDKDLYKKEMLEQLEIEAGTLSKISARMKQPMTAYYNTAQKIVQLMWDEGNSLVGVSRGSAMGFLSNFLLGVTQIEPTAYVGDMSWRHLSEDRPELPDVDLDSEGAKREQILAALKNFFGHDRVLNIATFGTEGTKSALATAARGLEISADTANYLSGLVPNERGFDWGIRDMVYGNPEKDRRPVGEFVAEIKKHEKYLETALAIEGMVKSRGSHASGVYIFNHPYTDVNAMMKTSAGLEITQWDYHDSDDMGGLKMDMLSVEALDKIRKTMDLLIEDELMEWKGSLKETYDFYLHPSKLDYSREMWEPTWDNKVLDVFQLDTPVGKESIRKGRPEDVKDAAALNSLMRLMATEDGEMPVDKFARFKVNIQEWYADVKRYNVPDEEIPILERHFLSSYGVPNTQEELMLILMDSEICNFTEGEANVARKIIGKKQMDKIPELKEQIFDRALCSKGMIQYIWDSAVSVQMGYSFSILHTIAYTVIALQELNLYNHYPSIYWNTGCLVVNSGDETGTSTDYSKMAVALGATINHGISVDLVDINESAPDFSPDADRNVIKYGFRPLTGVGHDFIQKILSNRPFTSLEDFMERAEPNKTQMLNLIKAGAFMGIDNEDRRVSLAKYAKFSTGRRKNLSITQLPLVVKSGLLPDSLMTNYSMYEFNRYIKSELMISGEVIKLDERAEGFLIRNGLDDIIDISGDWTIARTKEWSKIYEGYMNEVRKFLSGNKEAILDKIFWEEVIDLFREYGGVNTYAQWEMESMNFYYTEHELKEMNFSKYGVSSFSTLPREPEKENPNVKFPRNKLSIVIGTVISKNKTKGNIHLLTPQGDVVLVKMYKGDFSYWDKQISVPGPKGTKVVSEKSFFERGNKLYITGFRRDDQFVPKSYTSTKTPMIGLITGMKENGDISLKTSRG